MFKRIVISLFFILFLLGLFVAGYFFYQYKTKQLIQNLATQLAPVATIHYEQETSDIKGLLHLRNVRISPVGYRDQIMIDKVDIVAEDMLALLGASNWFKSTLPQQLKLQLSGIILQLDADFIGQQALFEQAAQPQKTIWGLACADENNFATLASSLGVKKIQFDSQLDISSDEDGRGIQFSLAMQAPGLVRTDFSFELESKVPIDFHDRMVLSQTKVANASLKVTDAGFNIKRLQYCAKEEGIPESNYLEFYNSTVLLKLIGDPSADVEEFESGVMSFFKPRASVLVGLVPKYDLNLPYIFSADFDLLKTDGFTLQVGAKQVATRYLAVFNGHSVVYQPEVKEQEDQLLATIRQQALEKQKIDNTPRYRDVPIQDLATVVGKVVRLQTKVGRELDGVLLQVEADRIVMRRRVEQGLVTYPVQKENLSSVKIFR